MDFRDSISNDFDRYEHYDGYGSTVSRLPRIKERVAPTSANLIIEALSPEVKNLLAPALRTVTLKKEEFLNQEGDRIDYIYFPITAVLSEFKTLEDGRMVEIAVTGNGGAVGLSSVLSGSSTAMSCTQVSQAGIAKRIDSATFARLLKTNEKMRTGLNVFLDQYIRQISQKAICNMYHSVKERLCTWLLMVQDRCGHSKLTLTHEQIARTLGVYRPSVTCIAQELREQKLINYSRGGISIISRERVKKSACTCYAELSLA